MSSFASSTRMALGLTLLSLNALLIASLLNLYPHFFRFTLFVTALNAITFALWLRKTLAHFDSARVVPSRVRAALDTLAEGLLVLDQAGRIAFVNRTFADTIGRSSDQLMGKAAASLPLAPLQGARGVDWPGLLVANQPRCGIPVSLTTTDGQQRVFKVNVAPIVDDRGGKRGMLASFDDVTAMVKKKGELLEMLGELKKSRDRIRKQNRQLQVLATRDGLTGCLNRRSFFEACRKAWDLARRQHQPVSCIMVDVDHFKSVNDTFGHSTGDEVLAEVAAALRKSVHHLGVLGRYGGEEFCVLLPGLAIAEAAVQAESYREAVASVPFNGFNVTASFGVSSSPSGGDTAKELMDQADQCLYAAKRKGRNCVVRWDEIPSDARTSGEETTTNPKPRDDAFRELRRWAGVQFDPVLVEHFIEVVRAHGDAEEARDPHGTSEPAPHFSLRTEHPVRSINEHDLESVSALATRLEATASKYGTEEIARIARDLHSLSNCATDLDQVIHLAHELVDLCTHAHQACAMAEHDLPDADLARRQPAEHPSADRITARTGWSPPA